jgi:hypothetical protein
MADRIDADVNAVQPPSPPPALDRVLASAQRGELAHRNDSVLPVREGSDGGRHGGPVG